MNKEQEDIVKNVEFLIKKLQEEWEKSGEMKKAFTMSKSSAEILKKRIFDIVNKQQQMVETKNISFKRQILMSKNNYVLLRLIKKIKEQEEVAEKNNKENYLIMLDREEAIVFQKIYKIKI